MDFANLRVGIGHDTHRLIAGGPLRIGGIDIPFDRRLEGHSDADVLLHAVTDAVLGAAAMGDIGDMFPDTDPANRDRDSREMLQIAMNKVRMAGYRLLNIDCIVFAEQPKFSPFKRWIEESLAEALGTDSRRVCVKAKTGERLGDVGAMNCMMAQCVALIVKQETG